MNLILKKTASIYGIGSDDDYVVLDDNRCVGRIFSSPHSPANHPWMWTITAREQPRSIHTRGYSATRKQAMQNFKTQWIDMFSGNSASQRY
jgi:hypothetical protein